LFFESIIGGVKTKRFCSEKTRNFEYA